MNGAALEVAILDDLRRIVRTLRQSSSAAVRQVGLTGAQLFVLKTLAGAPASSLNELAEATRTDQSTVSVVVKRLVERGLVHRAVSAVDGRRVALRLTPAGRAVLRQAPDAAQEALLAGIERLAPRLQTELARSLHALVEAMDLLATEPVMFFEDEEPGPRRAQPGRPQPGRPQPKRSMNHD